MRKNWKDLDLWMSEMSQIVMTAGVARGPFRARVPI